MYNDDQILSEKDYEAIAKAYQNLSNNERFQFLISRSLPLQDVEEILTLFGDIRTLLLNLGGFMGTAKFYSLHCRQLKKIEIIFEKDVPLSSQNKYFDKTKTFLSFLSKEFALTQKMFSICDKILFEEEIRKIINDRLILLSQTFAL